ncbi:MAG: glycosyltransferase [Syntrophobacteraceae bacterium]|nr:tetratricopeptide repeat protein [Desulfobacteraceae bacterium]
MIGILFSKDRGMQLDATLRSFFRHCRDTGMVDLKVLYTASSALHEQQYDDLRREYGSVEFLKEEFFRNDVLALLMSREYVLFLADDAVFVRGFRLADAVESLQGHTDAIGFSLRLGENTTGRGPQDAPRNIPALTEVSEGIIKYRWIEAEHDFGVPLELSGSVYRTQDLLALLKQLPFMGPADLEAGMDAHKSLYAQYRPFLLCHRKSIVFRNPVDKTPSGSPDGSAGDCGVEKLAVMFRDGLRIAVEVYDGFTPESCKQAVEPQFRQAGKKRPRVSVVVPCPGHAREHLPETLSSVMHQVFRDLEIILVHEDGGTDVEDASEILTAEDASLSVRTLRCETGSRASLLNRGISEAGGEYVLPLDAGDTIASDALQFCVALLDSNLAVAVAYTDSIVSTGGESWRENAGEFELQKLMNSCGIPACALYCRFLWEQAKGYKENAGDETWDFWLTCCELGFQGRRIPEPLLARRPSGSEDSSKDQSVAAETKARIVLAHPGLFDIAARNQAESLLANSLVRWDEKEGAEITRMLEAASRALSRQDLQGAATILAACAQMYPAYTGSYLALSELMIGEEQLEAAAAILEAGVGVVAEEAVLLKRLGTIRYSTGDAAGAEKAFLDARALSPRDPDILLSLANIYNGEERFAESLERLHDALKIIPRDVEAWISAALAADRLQDYDKAQFAFDRACALDPEHPLVKKLVAMSLENEGKQPEESGE